MCNNQTDDASPKSLKHEARKHTDQYLFVYVESNFLPSNIVKRILLYFKVWGDDFTTIIYMAYKRVFQKATPKACPGI
jgi:hypothetical protein